jgi:scyllo-inositol 2-dehydrogenase (NADP+)
LERIAARTGLKLSVFHNRRWDSDFLTLKSLLAEGALGELRFYRARWDRFRPEVAVRWRERDEAGAGILYDLGSHLIDQALCLFGPPDWVQANLCTQRAGAVVDDAFEILMGRGALRIALAASSVVADHAFRYQLDGTLASYRKSGLDPQEAQLRAGMSPTDRRFGVEPRTQWGRLTVGATTSATRVEPQRGTWSSFYRQMRAAIETDAPLPVKVSEACKVLQIIEAARRSAAERCAVTLQWPV